MKKTLILITGPICAGKSTLAKLVLNNLAINKMEYISTDLYFKTYFRSNEGEDSNNYDKAKKYCQYKLNKAIFLQNSFCWETVIAKKDKLETLEKCKKMGYKILTLFICVDDFEEIKRRNLKRYNEGWYSVPDIKLKSRYTTMMDNLKQLIQLSDEFIAIDSTDGYKIIFSAVNGKISIYEKKCNWINI